MPYEDTFSEDDWFLLRSTPVLVGAAMANAGRSGILGTLKEAMASSSAVGQGAKELADNGLISEMLRQDKEAADGSVTAAVQLAREHQSRAMSRLEESGVKDGEDLIRLVLDDCREVARMLDSKAAPEDASGYRSWALGVAESVAKAAKEGGFLGIGGERVSEGEKQLLEEIRTALS